MEQYKKCKFKRYCLGITYDNYPASEKPNKYLNSFKYYKRAEYADVEGEGYIIGECYKYEGEYQEKKAPSGLFYDDYEPAALIYRKRVNFYKVLVSYNNIVLVNKSDIIFSDI